MNRFGFAAAMLVLGGVLLLAPAAWASQGGCCYPSGECVESVRDDICRDTGGLKPGSTTAPCSSITCPEPEGGTCSVTEDCFPGIGLECLEGTCVSSKMAPAASTTGVVALIIALAIGGVVAVRRSRI